MKTYFQHWTSKHLFREKRLVWHGVSEIPSVPPVPHRVDALDSNNGVHFPLSGSPRTLGAAQTICRESLEKAIPTDLGELSRLYAPETDLRRLNPEYIRWSIRFALFRAGVLDEMSLAEKLELHEFVSRKFDNRFIVQDPETMDEIVDPDFYLTPFGSKDNNVVKRLSLKLREQIQDVVVNLIISKTREILGRRDGLTNLLKREAFFDNLNEAIAKRCSGENESPLSLLYIDIDNFKKVNDGHGHPAGDDVLRLIGKALRDDSIIGHGRHCSSEDLQGGLRRIHDNSSEDISGRIGGEEFAVMLEGVDVFQAALIAERLRIAFSQMKCPDGNGNLLKNLSLSIGVAGFQPQMTVSIFAGCADSALYVSKNGELNGRETQSGATFRDFTPGTGAKNRVTIFVPGIDGDIPSQYISFGELSDGKLSEQIREIIGTSIRGSIRV